MIRHGRQLRTSFSLLALIVIGRSARAVSSYTVTDLGVLPGEASSYAYGINNAGDVVGTCVGYGTGALAFLYHDGVMTSLGTLGGPTSSAHAINNLGQIVGVASINSTAGHAFIYSNGAMNDLGTLGGITSQANAINDLGQVTGYSFTDGTGHPHAFLYSNGAMTDIGTIINTSPNVESFGYGISNDGQIVGAGYGNGPFLYAAGNATRLPTPGVSGFGSAINNAGDIVGSFGLTHAFLIHDGSITDLGSLGGDDSTATAINNLGDVVGYSSTLTAQHAFLYSDGTMIDLNSLLPATSGWNFSQATGINDSGQITGYGHTPQGLLHAFLLTPTPEPATFLYFTLSLPALFTRRLPRFTPNVH